MRLECTIERPWGVHPKLLNDAECPRCGWTAPGPASDAREARAERLAEARELGFVPYLFPIGDSETGNGAALAA